MLTMELVTLFLAATCVIFVMPNTVFAWYVRLAYILFFDRHMIETPQRLPENGNAENRIRQQV